MVSPFWSETGLRFYAGEGIVRLYRGVLVLGKSAFNVETGSYPGFYAAYLPNGRGRPIRYPCKLCTPSCNKADRKGAQAFQQTQPRRFNDFAKSVDGFHDHRIRGVRQNIFLRNKSSILMMSALRRFSRS